MAYIKRKHERIQSLNLLNYTCLDEVGNVVSSGMGRTLDVSENGILLETHYEIAENTDISISIGLKDEVVDIVGKVIYSRQEQNGVFQAGVEFQDADTIVKQVLNDYIRDMLR